MDDAPRTSWERVQEILHQLVPLSASQRTPLLEDFGVGDSDLRGQIERLLDTYDTTLRAIAAGFPELLSQAHSALRTFSDGQIVAERFRIVRLLGHGGMG